MDIPLLPDIVAIFCLSIGVLLVCHQVKIPPIVGFLLTGVLCGPTALGLVQNPHAPYSPVGWCSACCCSPSALKCPAKNSCA